MRRMRRPFLAAALDAERATLADTVASVGADAPTTCGGWTAGDVAAHVVSLERFGGLTTFLGRSLVARGVRLNDRVPSSAATRAIGAVRRGGDAAVLADLRSRSPALLTRPSVAHIGIFEVWTHHEDIRAANGLERRPAPEARERILTWLTRYQRTEADTAASDAAELILWLAGRIERDGVRLPPI
jgi:uncharacterized protein (TIGR03083 family)